MGPHKVYEPCTLPNCVNPSLVSNWAQVSHGLERPPIGVRFLHSWEETYLHFIREKPHFIRGKYTKTLGNGWNWRA
jgi:hypothetical protein